jgi:hypothetical protein
MAAEIVFSGGERVRVPSADANSVMAAMVTQGPRDYQAPDGIGVRPGFVDFESDHGVVYVRPDQVAYVRDEQEMAQVEEIRGGLHVPKDRTSPTPFR